MIEGVLVLPMIMFVLSLVIYFGVSMKRFQRMAMMDRYEARRSVTRSPGPGTGITPGSSASELREVFFLGDSVRVGVQPTDYFPPEAAAALEVAAESFAGQAGLLFERYRADLPRGRSFRFFVAGTSGVGLWDRLFPGAMAHRHALMDTDWRFFNYVVEANEWYDDRSERWELLLDPNRGPDDAGLPTLGPADSVREAFYSDFDRRLDAFASSNPLASRMQDFFLAYPAYLGPTLPANWSPQTGWTR